MQPGSFHRPQLGQNQPRQPVTYLEGPRVQIVSGPVIPMSGVNINDYLWANIFATIFCCFPLGLVGICYSVATRNAKNMGNIVAARRNSNIARDWFTVAVIFGVIIGAIVGLSKFLQVKSQ